MLIATFAEKPFWTPQFVFTSSKLTDENLLEVAFEKPKTEAQVF